MPDPLPSPFSHPLQPHGTLVASSLSQHRARPVLLEQPPECPLPSCVSTTGTSASTRSISRQPNIPEARRAPGDLELVVLDMGCHNTLETGKSPYSITFRETALLVIIPLLCCSQCKPASVPGSTIIKELHLKLPAVAVFLACREFPSDVSQRRGGSLVEAP